jgi:hypothetical protein
LAAVSTQGQGHRSSSIPRNATGRLLAVVTATLMAAALLPAGSALADGSEPRGTQNICPGDPASDFDDIEDNAHEHNIRCMADRGLTEGVGDGSQYAPRRAVRRDQMASFIARFVEDYLGEELEAGDEGRFDDVDEDNVHRDNIAKLANIDVVGGTGDGQTYSPGAEITRGQMAALIRRALSWLDDGDATNGSAPEDADESSFGDTADSVHGDDIDALAEQGIVAGFDDGDYRPQDDVRRDQMASFVMRGYDYAIEAELGEGPEDLPEDVAAILDPTGEQPRFPVAPGDEIDITFATDRSGEYVLEYRDPAPQGGGFPLFPTPGEGEPGDWTEFDGDEATGAVDAGTHEASVTLPSDEEDDGVRDLRLVFEYGSTTVTVTETAALVVGDGVVINLTQETLEFSIQDAVDEADDGDDLLAIGEFDELVEIDGISDLSLGALPDTVLAGSIDVVDADGLSLSELTITDYETFSPLGLGIVGDEIGVAIADSDEVTLAALSFEGSGDDTAVVLQGAVDGVLSDSTFEGNDVGLLVDEGATGFVADGNEFVDNATGIDVRATGAGITGNLFEGNTTGVIVFGGTATVSGNEFDQHVNVAVDLISASATVADNVFGVEDGEHICYPDGEYVEQRLLEDNTFDYEDEPRSRAEGDSRTCIGPPEPEDDDDDGDDGEEESDDGGASFLPLP